MHHLLPEASALIPTFPQKRPSKVLSWLCLKQSFLDPQAP